MKTKWIQGDRYSWNKARVWFLQSQSNILSFLKFLDQRKLTPMDLKVVTKVL